MKNRKNKLPLRCLLFGAGVFLNGFGVAFITKSDLGTTPIASIPYTLSMIFPRLTIGNFTIIVSMILILLQFLILRRKAEVINLLLQIPMSFLFGYVIDFSMWLLHRFDPQVYPEKIVGLLIGCLIIGFGAFFEVTGDVVMLPADGFANAIAKVSGKQFSSIKLITDSSQAGFALVLGLIILHRLAGVREGTIIGALLIGNIVKVIGHFWKLGKIFQE